MLSEHVASVLEHKKQVAAYLQVVIGELMRRAIEHDNSKLSLEEVELFEEVTARLKKPEYGSEEYKAALQELGPALQHHYECNDHHPEHHAQGIDAMNLIQLIELACDWLASAQNGDIEKSLEINRARFAIQEQLFVVLKNTIDTLSELE